MKLLFTVDTLTGGGTETSLLQLTEFLSKKNEVTVIYFYPDHSLKAQFEQTGCRLVFADLKGKYSFFKGIFFLMSFLRRNPADAIICSLYRASIVSRLAGYFTATKVIDTMVSDSYGSAKQKEFKGVQIIKHKIVFFLDRISAGIPIGWISNSQTIANSMGKCLQIPPNKISVVYRGRSSKHITEWQCPTDNSRFTFVAVGRLFPAKDYTTLIKAFQKLKIVYPTVELVIYGEGPLRNELEALVKELGVIDSVTLPGRVDTPSQYFSNAHCYILSSVLEGFSGALIEAMMTGIPVIASSIPMNLEAADDGVTATFFNTSNIDSLIAKMQWVITHHKEACLMGKKARLKAIQQYDLSQQAATYLKTICHFTKK